MWASLLGKSNCDVEALAIAAVGAESYGVIGLNSVVMKGNSTSSYWSDGAGGTGSLGNVASNGDITLTNGATINGNARSYGGTVSGGTVTGSTSPLAMPLSFPPGDAGDYATNNDNNLIPNWAKLGNRLILGKNQSADGARRHLLLPRRDHLHRLVVDVPRTDDDLLLGHVRR